jgi:hypothetical protein
MVPGPESNNSLEAPTCISTAHELRFNDGTHVPEPKMVTVMPDLVPTISYQAIMSEITALVNFIAEKQVS